MSKETIKIKIKELDPDMIAPSTSNMQKEGQGGSKIVIIGKPGCFAKGTQVLMYDGSMKAVEDVKLGDLVMGDDSTPRRVLELCQNRENMYQISPIIGEGYVVNEQHKLVLQSTIYDKSIIEISVFDYIHKDVHWKKRYRIIKRGVDFDERYRKDLPLPEDFSTKSKEIPLEYLTQRREYRLRLLKHFINSSARFNQTKSSYEIDFSGEKIADDFLYLARSLGYSAFKFRIFEKTYSRYLFRVEIFSVSQYLEHNTDFHLSYKFRVEFVGVGDYYGFTLDGNHRFLLGTFDVVRNTGKSTLITSLLYEKSHIFSSGMICSGTEDSNHHYSKIFPESFVYGSLVPTKIQDFIDRQKMAKKYLANPWSVLLLDDCTDDPKLFNDPMFQGIFKNGRHWKMWFILSLQYCLDVKPVIRTNIDGTFILRETNFKNRKSLWENYAGVIPDFTMFCNIMDQITTDYTSLYIHNATTSNRLEDCVFWYKAKPVPESFRFGSEEYWDFHNQRFDKKRSILA
jgi:hypothetical protein